MTGISICVTAGCSATPGADAARTFGPGDHHAQPGTARARRPAGRRLTASRILAARPAGSTFDPLMVLYLTDQNLGRMHSGRLTAMGQAIAAKTLTLPARRPTPNSGNRNASGTYFPALEAMADVGMPLLVHGEVTHAQCGYFDREKAFIDQQLVGLVERFPTLKVVFEHITTADAVDFVRSAPPHRATITAHHLLNNATTCWWAVSGRTCSACRFSSAASSAALCDAVASGSEKFFLVPTQRRMPPCQRGRVRLRRLFITAHAALEAVCRGLR